MSTHALCALDAASGAPLLARSYARAGGAGAGVGAVPFATAALLGAVQRAAAHAGGSGRALERADCGGGREVVMDPDATTELVFAVGARGASGSGRCASEHALAEAKRLVAALLGGGALAEAQRQGNGGSLARKALRRVAGVVDGAITHRGDAAADASAAAPALRGAPRIRLASVEAVASARCVVRGGAAPLARCLAPQACSSISHNLTLGSPVRAWGMPLLTSPVPTRSRADPGIAWTRSRLAPASATQRS